MGNRASIQFKKNFPWGEVKSAVFYSHDMGLALANVAERYVRDLAIERRGRGLFPLDRLEPSILLVDFIARFLNSPVNTGFKIYRSTEECVDAEHRIIDVDKIMKEVSNENL